MNHLLYPSLKTRLLLLSCLISCWALGQQMAYTVPKTVHQDQRASLIDVLTKLEKNLNISFDYDAAMLQGKTVKATQVKNAPTDVEAYLNTLLQRYQLRAKRFEDNTYVIYLARQVQLKKLENNLLQQKGILFQELIPRVVQTPRSLRTQSSIDQVISGRVTDLSTNEPLPGVNILAKGTAKGTVSDVDGNYRLTLDDEVTTLVFSSIGYEMVEEEINGRSVINLSLSPDIQSLSEVVVVGYGQVAKEDLTGSVSVVDVEEAQLPTTTSVSGLMQGRVSGVSLSSASAQPGAALDIQVRGSANPPLIVVDGVPLASSPAMDPGVSGAGFQGGVNRDFLSTLNPADIESINILKDAGATAIYGSAAANGVVLITTKRGKVGQASVSYAHTYSIQNHKPYYPLLDATGFMQQANRLSFERHLYNNDLAPYSTVDYTDGYTAPFSNEDIAGAGQGTDWLDLVLRTGNIQEHNFSISGGSEKVKTFASFNYFKNKGILENSDFTRYTARINTDYEATPWLKIGLGLAYTRTNANNSSTSFASGPESFNQVLSALQFPPNVAYNPNSFDIATKSPYDPQLNNPVSFLSISDESLSSRIFATPQLELTITPKLSFNVQAGYDGTSFERYFFMPGSIENLLAPNGLSNSGLNKNYNISSEEYLSYDTKIGSSQTLNVVLGVGYYQSGSNGFGASAYEFFTDAFGSDNIGIATNREQTGVYSFRNENTKLSQFVRLNYSLYDKYLVSLTARRDGSSTFAENNKFGVFPGVSVAWKMEEEAFIKNINSISQLKLRVGYGATGNENLVGNFPLTLYASDYNFRIARGGNTINGVSLFQLGNPNITWQTDVMTNIGLDFGFAEDRFFGTLDVYRKTMNDLLSFDPLPANSPIGQLANNVGSMRSQGFDFNFTSRILTGALRWTNDVNVSWVKVNWRERNPKQPLNPWQSETDEVSAIFGWQTDGLIRSTDDIPEYMPEATVGNIKYVDISGPDGTPDGVLDANDVVKLGNGLPRWNIGMNNQLNYKNFDLSVFIYGQLDQERMDGFSGNNRFNNYYSWDRIAGGNNANRFYNGSTFVQDIWTSDNPNGLYPGVADDIYAGDNPTGLNDYYLLDASFLRIKNIMLGYQLPQKVVGRTNFIRSLRVFASVDNVALITNWRGLDPEINEVNPYPQVLTTSFGLNVTF